MSSMVLVWLTQWFQFGSRQFPIYVLASEVSQATLQQAQKEIASNQHVSVH